MSLARKEGELHNALADFISYDSKHKSYKQRYSIAAGMAVLSAGSVLFILNNASENAVIWFFLSAAALSLSLPVSLHALKRLRRCERARNDLAKKFFNAGFRVEGKTLMTNVAHSEVVIALDRDPRAQ